MAISRADFWSFIIELVKRNPNLGIPALEDELFAVLLIFEYSYYIFVFGKREGKRERKREGKGKREGKEKGREKGKGGEDFKDGSDFKHQTDQKCFQPKTGPCEQKGVPQRQGQSEL